MRYLSVLLLLLPFVTKAQTRAFKGETQTEINYYAEQQYKLVDSTMTSVFKLAIRKHNTDSLFVRNLRKSQKIWELWRGLEINTFYPKYPDCQSFYGSMQPVCYFSKLIDWTEERIKQLNIYVDGVSKDDLCGPGRE